MKTTVLAIAGKPGLYKLLSRGKNNLIVEALDATHKRQPTFNSDRIIALSEIAMYTNGDDIALYKVLESMKKLEDGKHSSVNPKTATGDELREYFGKILPDFDRDRVHVSDIKKLIQWYNILVDNDMTDFVDEENAEEETADTKEEADSGDSKPEAKAEEDAPKAKAGSKPAGK